MDIEGSSPFCASSPHLCYALEAYYVLNAIAAMGPIMGCSSVVERDAVNIVVAGSRPAIPVVRNDIKLLLLCGSSKVEHTLRGDVSRIETGPHTNTTTGISPNLVMAPALGAGKILVQIQVSRFATLRQN